MSNVFDRLPSIDLDTLLELVRHPENNLSAAALLAAAVTLTLILAIVIVLWLMSSERHEDEDGAAPVRTRRVDREPRTRASIPPIWWIVAGFAVVILAVPALFAASGESAHCATCHEATEGQSTDSAHTDCVSCHEDRGLAPFSVNVIQRIRMESSRVSGRSTVDAGDGVVVPSRRCLSCHELEDMDAVGALPVRMSHEEPLDAGIRCTECHGSMGVHENTGVAHPTMAQCIDCHDGEHASSACDTCHVGDPSSAVRTPAIPVNLLKFSEPTNCEGCHETESCRSCHGLDLPHSEEFVRGGHRMLGAFTQRQVNCTKCHSGSWCVLECHQTGDPNNPNRVWGHPENWAETHKTQPPELCGRCHSPGVSCEGCHG